VFQVFQKQRLGAIQSRFQFWILSVRHPSPFCEFTSFSGKQIGLAAISISFVAIPAALRQFETGRHADKRFDFNQPLHRIQHLIACAIFSDEPIYQEADLPPVFRPDLRRGVVEVFEVFILLEHRSLVAVVGGRDAMIVCVLTQPADVFQIVAADHIIVLVVRQTAAPRPRRPSRPDPRRSDQNATTPCGRVPSGSARFVGEDGTSVSVASWFTRRTCTVLPCPSGVLALALWVTT
jgi:hypothetical protein